MAAPVILELDQGNTRCKWRLLQVGRDGQARVCGRGVLASQVWHSDARLPEEWRAAGVVRARVANVAGAAREQLIAEKLSSELGLSAEFARVTARCGGVTCAYPEPGRLGVDRWLAVLAAHARDPSPALVVDCGSAITLDLLGSAGHHLGGYIVPGLALMRRALFQDTDAVKVADALVAGMSLEPGRDTVAAVNRGLSLMVLGVIEQALAQLSQVAQLEAAPEVWLTGGDAALVASLLPSATGVRPRVVDELVMEGLALTNP